MSVIGPRPGLWNQDILTAERDKYNAMLICLQFLKILVEENVVGLCILILAGSIIYFVCLILLRDRFFIDNITSVVKRKKI